jgi:hypothetical protein
VPADRRQNGLFQVLGGGGFLPLKGRGAVAQMLLCPCRRKSGARDYNIRKNVLKSTRMKRLFCSLAIFFFFFRIAGALSPAYSPAEKKIFEQLNQERKKAGLPELEWNDLAAEAARRHATLLAGNGKLSHQFSGEPSLPERLGATGARFTLAAENVALTDDVEDVHPALMNSPGHRANMLGPSYTAVGIGVIEEKGRFYVTQDFILRVPVYSEEQFSAALLAAFVSARKSEGRAVAAQTDSYLHDLACSTEGDAASLAGRVSGRYVVVFNSSEPHHVPEQMLKAAAMPNYRRMSFGACFRPDKEHGYGNFWVVAVFDTDPS